MCCAERIVYAPRRPVRNQRPEGSLTLATPLADTNSSSYIHLQEYFSTEVPHRGGAQVGYRVVKRLGQPRSLSAAAQSARFSYSNTEHKTNHADFDARSSSISCIMYAVRKCPGANSRHSHGATSHGSMTGRDACFDTSYGLHLNASLSLKGNQQQYLPHQQSELANPCSSAVHLL